ncbi:hypothetical protein BCR44DRAFT_1059211 [Catenaria anguillulae PL171]|uniref:Uncharacterized protein n=1 Tax=Catenaria anguillulae PL171 TaxID=765915 RepID=A0A1Y2HSI6_9FUNG|nr:hypothetical protein BCR44DRAFT_1059211 [Catenaria anguillulae PL171]
MRTGFATARVQTGPTLLGIPSQYHPDRYSLSPEQDDAALPPSPAFQFFDTRHSSIHHDNSQLPTVNDPLAGHVNDDDMDAEDKDDVLSELKYLARQVPDYGRRHSSTRPDTRDRSSIHLVGDPTLIMEGGSEIDYGFTDEQVCSTQAKTPTTHCLPGHPIRFLPLPRPNAHSSTTLTSITRIRITTTLLLLLRCSLRRPRSTDNSNHFMALFHLTHPAARQQVSRTGPVHLL